MKRGYFRHRRHGSGGLRGPSNLGALVMPENCDAQLVTTQRMLPDGSIGIFAGEYQLTADDLGRLEQWRQNCIALRQRAQDEALAAQVVAQGQAAPAPGWASAGPGSMPSQAVNLDLAQQYAGQISDPDLRQAAQNFVSHQRAPAAMPPVTSGGSTPGYGTPASDYPSAAGFPGEGPGGSSGAAPASSGTNWVPLVLLAATLLSNG